MLLEGWKIRAAATTLQACTDTDLLSGSHQPMPGIRVRHLGNVIGLICQMGMGLLGLFYLAATPFAYNVTGPGPSAFQPNRISLLRAHTTIDDQTAATDWNKRPRYEYTPLDRHTRQKKLLHLHVSQHGDQPLEGKIVIASLTDQPVYNALSYVWGSTTPEDEIIIDGRVQPITRNLSNALHVIRRHHEGDEQMVLWADGVCMDQSSIEEKNHQVPLMRTIFETAQMVLIWLDISIDTTTPSFRRFASTEPSSDDPIKSSEYSVAHVKDLLTITLQDYWRRIWIQGEVINAKETRAYFWNVVLSDRTFRTLLKHLTRFLDSQLVHGNKVGLKETRTVYRSCFSHLAGHVSSEPLTRLMTKYKGMNVTDYKDVVYGLLRLANDFDEGDSTLDYKLSVHEVFMAAFAHHVRKHGNLTFLQAVLEDRLLALPSEYLLDDRIPISDSSRGGVIPTCDEFTFMSWISSWLESNEYDGSDIPLLRDARASGRIPCLVDAISQQANIINVHGYSIGRVSTTIVFAPDDTVSEL